MEVRGIRECQNCGTRFSYYETGDPACPDCGSLHTVGVGDRALHTDRPADLELGTALAALEAGRYREAGTEAEETARRYVRRRGFIKGGELRDLDDTYLAAHEIKEVAQLLRLAMGPEHAAESLDPAYVKGLFEEAQAGSWPAGETVPETMAGARGLAVESAVDDYREALKTWHEATDTEVDAAPLLQRLDDHLRRVRALEGAIDPETADTLIDAARALGDYVRTGTDRAAVESALEELLEVS